MATTISVEDRVVFLVAGGSAASVAVALEAVVPEEVFNRKTKHFT